MRCAECGGPLPEGRRRYCADRCARRARDRRYRTAREAPPQTPITLEIRARLTTSIGTPAWPMYGRARDVDGISGDVLECFEDDRRRWSHMLFQRKPRRGPWREREG